MVQCTCCKNKYSDERCRNRALPGLSLCGKHVKSKYRRLWNVINNVDKHVTLISKIWKGYFIRKKLALAGSGVINRNLCNNTDELVSLEPISKVDVFDYFGFEESGKVYGFDIRTILDILQLSLRPANPYTRQPITLNDRKRLREVYCYRLRNKLETSYDKNPIKPIEVVLSTRWNQLSQIAEENGFFNIEPDLFSSLNKTQLYIFLSMIHNDLKTWAAEHNPVSSKRFMYAFWTNNVLKKFSNTQSVSEYSFYVSSILLSILYDSVESYNVCFIIMSALYRL